MISNVQSDDEDDNLGDAVVATGGVQKAEIDQNEMVLENDDGVKEEYYGHIHQNDHVSNEEDEQSNLECTYETKAGQLVHEDEEQFEEGDFEGYSNAENFNEDERQDFVGDGSYVEGESDQQQSDLHEYYDNYHEQEEGEYLDEENYGEEDGLNVDQTNELGYEDDIDYEDNQDSGNEVCTNGTKNGNIFNYGFACKYCGKFFSTRRGVESHEQHHKTMASSTIIRRPAEARTFPCKICKNKTFPSFKDLKSHVKTHTPERIHICKFCFLTFNNTASLTKHLTIHENQNPHRCHCGKTFVSANTLKIHKKIHTGIKPFKCNFFTCGRAFVTKSTLESHLRTHTGEKPYSCAFCPSSFTTSSAKYRHERHVHKVPEPSSV